MYHFSNAFLCHMYYFYLLYMYKSHALLDILCNLHYLSMHLSIYPFIFKLDHSHKSIEKAKLRSLIYTL